MAISGQNAFCRSRNMDEYILMTSIRNRKRKRAFFYENLLEDEAPQNDETGDDFQLLTNLAGVAGALTSKPRKPLRQRRRLYVTRKYRGTPWIQPIASHGETNLCYIEHIEQVSRGVYYFGCLSV